MSSKFYIETNDGGQFIIQADDAGQAIAMFWCHELDPLKSFTAEQLDWICWSKVRVEPEYYIHQGRRGEGCYVHSRCALNWLTGWQIRLAVDCLVDQYGLEVVQDFVEK